MKKVGSARTSSFFETAAFFAFSLSNSSQTNCPARFLRAGSVNT
jgi:hypothetical protein